MTLMRTLSTPDQALRLTDWPLNKKSGASLRTGRSVGCQAERRIKREPRRGLGRAWRESGERIWRRAESADRPYDGVRVVTELEPRRAECSGSAEHGVTLAHLCSGTASAPADWGSRSRMSRPGNHDECAERLSWRRSRSAKPPATSAAARRSPDGSISGTPEGPLTELASLKPQRLSPIDASPPDRLCDDISHEKLASYQLPPRITRISGWP